MSRFAGACSSAATMAGLTRRTSTSDVDERMFVRCFSRTALTSRSSDREFSPTTMPS